MLGGSFITQGNAAKGKKAVVQGIKSAEQRKCPG
jgi:hypothetical protein